MTIPPFTGNFTQQEAISENAIAAMEQPDFLIDDIQSFAWMRRHEAHCQ
jgi:hypothetical protein